MRFLPVALLSIPLLAECSADSIEDQAQKLGSRDFTAQAWTAGSQEERGQMIASFLAKYKATDLTGTQVKNLLGPSTGYYNYDEYPAYLASPHLWVFITDKSNGEVRQVILAPPVEGRRD